MSGKLYLRCRRLNIKQWLLITVIVTVVLMYLWTRSPSTNSRHVKPANKKLVLLWTPFFRQSNWVTNDHFTYGCAVNACVVTEDKDRLLDSDAVLFHERDIGRRSELPRVRTEDQRWIWLSQETVMSFESNISEYRDVFNWTMTYRRDSDVFIPYGAVLKKSKPITKLDLDKSIAEDAVKRRKLVAIRISNCASRYTDRMKYVNKLREYIPVTVLGKCGESCDLHDNCNDDYMRQFKFYLSFENSHCKDYITEKLWLPLHFWNNVPVVMGGSSREDYEAVAPPNSYIHVDTFKSPKHLAGYLTLLDKNASLYNEYFAWRRTHDYVFTGYCNLCAALHDKSLPSKTVDLVTFYNKDKKCSVDHPRYL